MKRITSIFFLSVLLISCNADKSRNAIHSNTSTELFIKIPEITIDKSELEYQNNKSIWLLNGQPFSGVAISHFTNKTLKEEVTIFKGKKENLTKRWFADGQLKQVANYHKGKLHGEKKVWSSESVLLSQLNYKYGKPHGKQMTWYPTGEIHKELNLHQGKEEGIQKAYRRNGALYANYEVKEGRIFGLKKAMLCFGLENESTLYEN